MATYTSVIPVLDTTYVKATSIYSTNFYAHFATDPARSVIGAWASNAWLSTIGTSQQRLHIDLTQPYAIRRIYYENLHENGGNSQFGSRAFTFWGSNDYADFVDTTYANDRTWVQLSTSAAEFDQHVALDQADPKYITVTNTVAYRYYAIKISTGWGGNSAGFRRVQLQTEDGYVPRYIDGKSGVSLGSANVMVVS